jgi:hypothetical protein
MTNTTDDRAISQARSQLQAICELVAAYDTLHKKGDDDSEVLDEIYGNPLGVSVRSDWQAPGSGLEPSKYQLLLCWGGPAVRVVGDLDGGDPVTAHLEYQDWFTQWQELPTSAKETEALIDYARFFHFGS